MATFIPDGLSAIVPQRALLPSARHAEYAVDGRLAHGRGGSRGPAAGG